MLFPRQALAGLQANTILRSGPVWFFRQNPESGNVKLSPGQNIFFPGHLLHTAPSKKKPARHLQSELEVPPSAGDSDHEHEEEFGIRTCFDGGQGLHGVLVTVLLKLVLPHCEQDNPTNGCHPFSQTHFEMFEPGCFICFCPAPA